MKFILTPNIHQVVHRSCTELVGTACELLEKRITDSGIILTSSLTSPSSGCGLVAASKRLTWSLLTSDSATEKMVECDHENFHTETDSVPSHSLDPRAVMLAFLESPGKSLQGNTVPSACTQTHLPQVRHLEVFKRGPTQERHHTGTRRGHLLDTELQEMKGTVLADVVEEYAGLTGIVKGVSGNVCWHSSNLTWW